MKKDDRTELVLLVVIIIAYAAAFAWCFWHSCRNAEMISQLPMPVPAQ